MELVDSADLESVAERRRGSSPLFCIEILNISKITIDRQIERKIYMLLQIDKFLKKEGSPKVMRTDIIGEVTRTNQMEDFVMVRFKDGSVVSFSSKTKDNSFKIDCSLEMHEYLVSQVWLLNDEGKTIRKLV